MISYEDFKKVEIKTGKIISAEKILDTDKLLKLSVDFNEYEEIEKKIYSEQDVVEIIKEKIHKPRQIISGIARYFPEPKTLIGKVCMFVTNLEPRTIKGYESNGMLFALSTSDGKFSLLEPNDSIPPGIIAG